MATNGISSLTVHTHTTEELESSISTSSTYCELLVVLRQRQFIQHLMATSKTSMPQDVMLLLLSHSHLPVITQPLYTRMCGIAWLTQQVRQKGSMGSWEVEDSLHLVLSQSTPFPHRSPSAMRHLICLKYVGIRAVSLGKSAHHKMKPQEWQCHELCLFPIKARLKFKQHHRRKLENPNDWVITKQEAEVFI